jgi:hypothetical protein
MNRIRISQSLFVVPDSFRKAARPRLARIHRVLSLVTLLALLAACGRNEEAAVEDAAVEAAVAADPATQPGNSSSPGTSAVISEARNALQAGQVDEAAAKLAQLQMQRATFTAREAKDYRQALSDAYDRAIEAAQRGDPKAEAAIKLLRAAAPR